ncbi:hypothetical protein C3L33_11989, partial [Rhododendron williamsianum]
MEGRAEFVQLLSLVVLVQFLVASAGPVSDPHWYPAAATWYGSPEGDGSDGGACGYGSLVDVKPLRARVGAVNPVLFKGGEGCGACYKVKCLDKSICSRRAVTVIITDECPGCSSGRTQFDLSGAAFGRMAIASDGSTDFWLSLLVEFEGGDGDVGSMHIKEASSTEWVQMQHIWGATWCITAGPLRGPFSVKLTTLSTAQTLSARDVIPSNWSPKATYTSRLNFS